MCPRTAGKLLRKPRESDASSTPSRDSPTLGSAGVATALVNIDMGLAVWDRNVCIRTTQGENCTTCVDQCPLGTAAIDIDGMAIKVKENGCIGCGVCQYRCPTTPKSINIVPRGRATT